MHRHQQSSRGELHSAADCQRCAALFDFSISCFVYMYAFLISCFDYFELFAFINQLFSIIQQAGRGCFIQFTNLTLFVPPVNINLTLTDFQNSLNISMYVYHFVINVGRRNMHWLTDRGNVQYFSLFALYSLWSISPLQFLQNGNWSLRTWPFYIRWNICQFLNYKLWPSKNVNLPTSS